MGNKESLHCVVHLKVLACETKNPEEKDKSVDLFRQKLVKCRADQGLLTEAELRSYKVAHQAARCKRHILLQGINTSMSSEYGFNDDR